MAIKITVSSITMSASGTIWSSTGTGPWTAVIFNTLNSPSPNWTNVAAGWIVTAVGINGRTTNFTTATVTGVSIADEDITITINGNYDVSDQDNVVYTFTAPVAPPSSGIACFVAGTRVLTANGYKAIETLTQADKIVTSEGREVSAKVYSFELPTTTKTSAPYRIEAGAFGRNLPAAPIALSPIHKIQVRPHLWTSPHDAAAAGNSRVKQYGVGEPIRYYHIECENYLRDNLVTEGLIVESLGHEGRYKGVKVYTWSKRFQGYTRISADPKIANK